MASPSCLRLEAQEICAGLFAGLGEDGEEDGGENRDDGDDDEKLD